MIGGNTERALDLLEEHAEASVIQLDWLEKDNDWDAARGQNSGVRVRCQSQLMYVVGVS